VQTYPLVCDPSVMARSGRMFLRSHQRSKDGKQHTYWSLVETVRTADGPRQRALCYLGELNGNAQARWLKTIEVFNEQGESRQLKLFPSEVEPPENDPNVARVLLNKIRLERVRQFGNCFVGLELTCGRGWDWIGFTSSYWMEKGLMLHGRELQRFWLSIGCVPLGASYRSKRVGIQTRLWTIC
jgi:hypothetical protein